MDGSTVEMSWCGSSYTFTQVPQSRQLLLDRLGCDNQPGLQTKAYKTPRAAPGHVGKGSGLGRTTQAP
jgi:hypothetical protein